MPPLLYTVLLHSRAGFGLPENWTPNIRLMRAHYNRGRPQRHWGRASNMSESQADVRAVRPKPMPVSAGANPLTKADV